MSYLLLTEIREFLAETGMGPSYFGKKSVGNSEVVSRLENGRSITIETADKIRRFMRAHRDADRRSNLARSA